MSMNPEARHPVSYDEAEAPQRQSQVMVEVERQGMILGDLTEAISALERRLAPVMIHTEKVPSEQLAQAREIVAPLADMIRSGNDATADCVSRLQTILRTLEV